MEDTRRKALSISEKCLGDKYRFVPDPTTGKIDPIGEGGTGIVYMAEQVFDNNAFIKRAVKFFMFKDILKEKYGYVSYENFKTEIINITQFNHQNILKVIDGDYYEIQIDERKRKIKIPYTVTEYIEGCTLENIFHDTNQINCRSLLASEEQIFDIFSHIAEGVAYLHGNNFYHCDIAPKNIFLKKNLNNEWFAILGDLGAGRTISEGSFQKARVIGTYDYMPTEVGRLKNEIIPWDDFFKLQPRWDIFSLVKTIRETIGLVKNSGYLSDTWHLECLDSKLQGKDYNDVNEVLEDIELLRPNNGRIFKLDELSEASNQIKQVLIPLYPAYLSYRMRSIARHSTMLRLMDVPELLEGTATFPGANHTRYEHALGTYELMRKAFIIMLRNKNCAEFFDSRTIIIGLISALLSSIIHFPLSYAEIELISQQCELLPDFSKREIFKKIVNYKSDVDNNLSILDIIENCYGEYHIRSEELEYVIFGKNTNEERNDKLEALYHLLNSSIGVRNIDYIKRDSYHIGIDYEIDIDALFSFMTIHDDDFCLLQTGITTAEQVVINRYWLFKRVYWCEPSRADIALLKHAFYLINSAEFYKKLLEIAPFATRSDIEKLLRDTAKENHVEQEIEAILKFLDQRGSHRYKRIVSIGKNYVVNNAGVIWTRFSEIQYAEQEKLRGKIEDEVKKYFDIKNEDCGLPLLLIDLPYENSNNKLGEDIIINRYDDNRECLTNASSLIESMPRAFNDQLKLIRVFLRPDIYEKYINDNEKIATSLEEKICGWLYKEL